MTLTKLKSLEANAYEYVNVELILYIDKYVNDPTTLGDHYELVMGHGVTLYVDITDPTITALFAAADGA